MNSQHHPSAPKFLIEIDIEGGLVQEVRTNQPGARVVVHDADAAEVGEDPRTNLVAVFEPTMGREDEDLDG